ncbi:MAG: molybdenum cofactor guanylyltransferase MobA, partial [Paracoccaceae bacterium]
MSVPGVILAGGQARRMGGGDKCLLEISGSSILSHVIKRIAPQVGELAINANGDPLRFTSYKLPVISDSFDGFAGPLAGILTAMEWAAEQGAERVVTVAADTPYFPTDLVARLLSAVGVDRPIALAATMDENRGLLRHPTFGLWPVDLRGDLRAALQGGTRKVVAWTDLHGAATALFEARDSEPFFNINTPQDLNEARANPA